ncbi:hypothetical protein [Halobellus inordinatus]|uniref:hypothetical protein n=1 Tax=Halobellus inordinatus TaxID=1126236 RepID=UPI00210AD774|nr:hypothetical protein [Halobellus inordinatus]
MASDAMKRLRGAQKYLAPDGGLAESSNFVRLWVLALATYGVGDIVTTIAIIEHSPDLREANALVRLSVDAFGIYGLALLKYAVFGIILAISLVAAADGDEFFAYLPPVVLSLVGTFTMVYNVRLLIG